ncbi:ABC transporter ATP-binding protein [Paenibacillus alkalitolerans]|uniref:ABC transporter ATP-binding protein n=1 Tax=Paenibacillus alkalitolerans TaxID=2799335 RepID=UPI0018F3038C|nr:ABC transporter ATP-binding protein [Paenibacillus alkalitolerans]
MANVKWLWSHVRRVKGLLLFAVVLMALEALSSLASVALQQSMIDDVFVAGKTERFWPVLIQISAAYLVYSLLFTFGPHAIHHAVAKLRLSMGSELMRHMFRVPTGTIQKERTADYVYHFTNDLQTCANAGGSDLPRLAQQLVTALVIAGVMAAASPYMLGAMLVFVALYIALGKRFGAARKKASAEVNKTRSALLVHLEEGVSSTREVIAFHRQEWESNIYRKYFASFFNSIMAEGKLINKQLLLSDPLKWGSLLFVLLYGGILVMNDELSLGMFVISVQFTTRMMDSFNGLYHFVMELSGKAASIERIRKVIEGDTIPEGTKKLSEPIRFIRFDSVCFRYGAGTQQVLKGISLTMEAGQKIAFVGSSGSGKSTIASLLARFFDPIQGTIAANGIRIQELKRPDWMSKVTIVFQEPYLFPDTIRTNLLLGHEHISEERLIEICRAMMIHDFIAGLPNGYDTVIGERGVTLSGGQRQRLALARAVLRDTEILILDEATSSLDLETERQVQINLDLLREGRMTIVIAHRLSTIRNANHIFVIDGGTVAEQGTHEELLRNDSIYRSLVLKEENKEQAVS